MTAHELARHLLTLPDLPVFHFDPSLAGLDAEIDYSLSEPRAEVNSPERWETKWKPFVTISPRVLVDEETWINGGRADQRRVDWIVGTLAKRGTDGLRDIIPWEPPCPPDRDSLDAAMVKHPL